MTIEKVKLRVALDDFRMARRRAALKNVFARISGRKESEELLSFEEAHKILKGSERVYRGTQEIPVDAIIGSVGRYTDFTRGFLPKRTSDAERWAKVKVKMFHGGGVPPIEVFQIGEAYFVLDGNHRVSIARQTGQKTIPANITEIETKVPLTPDDKPDDLIVKAELTDFFIQTKLDNTRPDTPFAVTLPGQYRYLLRQISRCQDDFQCDFIEAAERWHDEVFIPIIRSITESGLMRDFPNRTETDLYAWILRWREKIETSLGREIDLRVLAESFVEEISPHPSHIVARIQKKIRDILTPDPLEEGPAPGKWRAKTTATHSEGHLLSDFLVPVSGSDASWVSVQQAIRMAGREGDRLHGLHIVASKSDLESPNALAIKEKFENKCKEAGLTADFLIDHGKVPRKVCEMAVWSDMVILNNAHPPGAKPIRKLASGLHTIVRRCSRPILAVPQMNAKFERLLLAYDGSPKAKEALFIAAYLAGKWSLGLDVLFVTEQFTLKANPLKQARLYLESRDINAIYHHEKGVASQVTLQMSETYDSDIILTGGYGHSPVIEAVVGSTVDAILRKSKVPVMICR